MEKKNFSFIYVKLPIIYRFIHIYSHFDFNLNQYHLQINLNALGANTSTIFYFFEDCKLGFMDCLRRIDELRKVVFDRKRLFEVRVSP